MAIIKLHICRTTIICFHIKHHNTLVICHCLHNYFTEKKQTYILYQLILMQMSCWLIQLPRLSDFQHQQLPFLQCVRSSSYFKHSRVQFVSSSQRRLDLHLDSILLGVERSAIFVQCKVWALAISGRVRVLEVCY